MLQKFGHDNKRRTTEQVSRRQRQMLDALIPTYTHTHIHTHTVNGQLFVFSSSSSSAFPAPENTILSRRNLNDHFTFVLSEWLGS